MKCILIEGEKIEIYKGLKNPINNMTPEGCLYTLWHFWEDCVDDLPLLPWNRKKINWCITNHLYSSETYSPANLPVALLDMNPRVRVALAAKYIKPKIFF